jgi:hypothetical protein
VIKLLSFFTFVLGFPLDPNFLSLLGWTVDFFSLLGTDSLSFLGWTTDFFLFLGWISDFLSFLGFARLVDLGSATVRFGVRSGLSSSGFSLDLVVGVFSSCSLPLTPSVQALSLLLSKYCSSSSSSSNIRSLMSSVTSFRLVFYLFIYLFIEGKPLNHVGKEIMEKSR